MENTLSIIALVVSVFTLIANFIRNNYARSSFEDKVYERFVQMWTDIDKVFIEHPNMHKFFYYDRVSQTYAKLLPGDKDFGLGICIAEMFRDAFQYAAPLEKYLSENDKQSYEDYKKMIAASPIVQASLVRYQWH